MIRHVIMIDNVQLGMLNFGIIMMTSSNGSIFCVTGPLCGDFTGHQWIPHTKASDAELWCFLWSVPWINSRVNNHEAGNLRCHRTHYDVRMSCDTPLAWCNASHLTNGSTVFIWKLYCYWPKDLHQHNATLDIQTNALQLKLSQVAMNKFSIIHLNDAVFPTC